MTLDIKDSANSEFGEQHADLQRRMLSELQGLKKIDSSSTILPFNLNTQRIRIPAVPRLEHMQGAPERIIELAPNACQEHRWIFQVINYEIYEIFSGNSNHLGHQSRARLAHSVPKLFRYLDGRQTTPKNRLNLLNDYQEWLTSEGERADGNSYHATRSFLARFNGDPNKYEFATPPMRRFIGDLLAATKTPPPSDVTPHTIEKWFSEQPWLRDETIGIGHQKYSLLASPKTTKRSLQSLASQILLLSFEMKNALATYMRDVGFSDRDVIFPNDESIEVTAPAARASHAWVKTLTPLRDAYLSSEAAQTDRGLRSALVLLTSTTITTEQMRSRFYGNESLFTQPNHYSYGNDWLFTFEFLRDLATYAHSGIRESLRMPIMRSEKLAFQWLMASLCVQQSDIPKLRRSHFQIARNRGGSTTAIRCDYYKGRAKKKHPVPVIQAGDSVFRAVSRFLCSQFPDEAEDDFVCSYRCANDSPKSLEGWIRFLVSDFSIKRTRESFKKDQASMVMLNALHAISVHGVIRNSKTGVSCNPDNKVLTRTIFSLNAIKTTSVYAGSEDFDPTRLINWNSHSNSTEAAKYLTEANIEWINNTGRVTRLIMLDIARHIYHVDRSPDDLNRDFDTIRWKTLARGESVFSKLQVISGKQAGGIRYEHQVSESLLPDALSDSKYVVVDAPNTVMMYLHYLDQAEKHYGLLARNNPKFLLEEILPTVEWTETLINGRRFKSYQQGKDLYDKLRPSLPDLFESVSRAGI